MKQKLVIHASKGFLSLIICFGGAFVVNKLYLTVPTMQFSIAFIGGGLVASLLRLVRDI